MSQADFAKYSPALQKKSKPLTLVDKADELVDIRDIYMPMTGGYVPMGDAPSWKIFCPWGYEHADGGLDKNCRLYAPTHIYCFAMHGLISSTRLYARWKGVTRQSAAETLLEERGLLKHKNYREHWKELAEYREHKLHPVLGDQVYAIGALTEALDVDEDYILAEYSDEVREAWIFVLEVLDLLWQKPETDAKILQQWFNKSLTRLQNAAKEVNNV